MKQCPICKSQCFDDMEVCYGCMHRFNEKAIANVMQPIGRCDEFEVEEPKNMEVVASCLESSQPSDVPAKIMIPMDGSAYNLVISVQPISPSHGPSSQKPRFDLSSKSTPLSNESLFQDVDIEELELIASEANLFEQEESFNDLEKMAHV